MDSSIASPCPNCGYTIRVESTGSVFSCPYCREELVITPRRQLHLARPLADYALDAELSLAASNAARSESARYKIKKSMERRRQQSADMAKDRIAEEKQTEVRSLRIAWGLVLFIGLAAVGLVLRILAFGPDPISIIILFLILMFLPIGLILIAWSIKIIRLLDREANIQKTQPHP